MVESRNMKPFGSSAETPIIREGGENPMASAATYEQLIACWEDLHKKLDASEIAKFGTLAFHLHNVYTCFQKSPFACDSGVKNIFENTDLREQLKGMGVLEEFLLHTVRMGAIKSIESNIERNPQQSVQLDSDGTMSRVISEQTRTGRLPDPEAERERLLDIIRELQYSPTLDGYSWADKQLQIIALQRKAAQKEKHEEAGRQIEMEKAAAIDRARMHMREPDFHFPPAGAALLHSDFRNKLILWKAILERGVGTQVNDFLQQHGDEELTPEVFSQFKDFYDNHVKTDIKLPLEIIDPDSGWFSVLIINKQTTLRKFFSSAYGNMNSWFLL